MPQQTLSIITRLVRPEIEQTIIIPINADGIRLSLDFEPDPNIVFKNGQNLEFIFEDGGRIVLQGYYNYFASKSLPVMVLENGTELSGEDFLLSLREDLLTGANSGGSIPGSGVGEYEDDAGSLIEGVGRLDFLEAISQDEAAGAPADAAVAAGVTADTFSSDTIAQTISLDESSDFPGEYDTPGIADGSAGVSGMALVFGESYLQGDGGGMDLFAWTADDMDKSHGQILDFRYGSEMLRFENLLEPDGMDISELLSGSALQAAAVGGMPFLAAAQDGAGGVADISSAADTPLTDPSAFNSADYEAQAAILAQMIITTSGG